LVSRTLTSLVIGCSAAVLILAPAPGSAGAGNSNAGIRHDAGSRRLRLDNTTLVDSIAIHSMSELDSSEFAALPDSVGDDWQDFVSDTTGLYDVWHERSALGVSDSSRIRVEIGASSDFTNEQFFEANYTDVTLTTRHLVGTPETRMAGVLFAALAGTRANGAMSYRLHQDLSLGDKIQYGRLVLDWRHDLAPRWRYLVAPSFEYRQDRTFGRDLREWRGFAAARLRHHTDDRATELAASGEVVRSSGYGSDLVLDRQAAQISASLDRTPSLGSETHLGYRLAARVFPDSTSRDHVEHGWEGRWRRLSGAGHGLLIEAAGARRSAMHLSTVGRDDYWEVDGAVEGEARWSDGGALRARLSAETMHYDHEDDLAFFDYRLARARLGPRFERGSVQIAVESRAEALFAPRSASEEYRELGGALDLELLGAGAWWSLTPAAGWRDYRAGGSIESGALHSSFAFYEIGLLADQTLPSAVRVRLLASARHELHVDRAQDARSLYFSVDVRRLF
jgi:hypothetical protein